VTYVEEAHAPLFHWTATLPNGGRSVPVLVHNGRSYADSTEILAHLDELGGDLYPRDQTLRRDVLELEEHFDKNFGPHTRRWAYAQLLPHSRLLIPAMSAGIPRIERLALPAILPIGKQLIRKGLNITAESAIRSLDRVQAVFTEIASRIGDGRSFLVGDRMTAADVTFAALAAPVLFPAGYRGALPDLNDVPQTMREEVQSLRETVAGRYALRLFAEHRQLGG
jgi:glutathione S-transferase